MRIPPALALGLGFLSPLSIQAKDVYGNNVPWTIHDTIIADIQYKRAMAEKASSAPKGKDELTAWLEGKKEARERLRQNLVRQNNADEEDSDYVSPAAKKTPPAATVSYEAWAEEKDRKEANAGNLEAMVRHGVRLIKTGRSYGEKWIEDAAAKGSDEALYFLYKRSIGEEGGKVDRIAQKRLLKRLMESNARPLGRWLYAELLIPLYAGNRTPEETAEYIKMLEAIVSGAPEYHGNLIIEAKYQLAALYTTAETNTANIDRAIALQREAIAADKQPSPRRYLAICDYLAVSEGSYREHYKEIGTALVEACRASGPGAGESAERYFALLAGESGALSEYITPADAKRLDPYTFYKVSAQQRLREAGRQGCKTAWETLIDIYDVHVLPINKEIPYEAEGALREAGQLGIARAYGVLAFHSNRETDVARRHATLEWAELGIAQEDPVSYAARARLKMDDAKLEDWPAIVQDIWASAGGGFVWAMIQLSDHFTSGHGIDKDEHAGIKWMERAAEAGSTQARIRMARIYLDGPEYARWEQKGLDLLEDGVEHDVPAAMTATGELLLTGKHLTQDQTRAYQLFSRASAQGDLDASAWLAACLAHGWGCEKNVAEARRLLTAATEKWKFAGLRRTEPHGIE